MNRQSELSMRRNTVYTHNNMNVVNQVTKVMVCGMPFPSPTPPHLANVIGNVNAEPRTGQDDAHGDHKGSKAECHGWVVILDKLLIQPPKLATRKHVA